MWDRYDPRSSNDRDRDRDDVDDRSRGSRGGSGERDHAADRDPRDVFTKDLDLPRGRERRPVRERDRVYEIDGTESRMLATVGAFRVVSESDLHDGRYDTRKAQRHLEREGLLRTSPISSDDRAVVADHVLESISGHLSRRMLEHYSHIRIDAKRQALDSLDNLRRAGDAANGNGKLADDTEIATIVEVADDLTSQSRHSLLLSGSPPSGKLLIPLKRRDGRVVEGARLESDLGDAHRVIPEHLFA
jgi:hypothetical protein